MRDVDTTTDGLTEVTDEDAFSPPEGWIERLFRWTAEAVVVLLMAIIAIEVVSRGLGGMRALIELGIARGEIREKELARFPQILVAPALIAVIWQSLFARHAPLDVDDMLRVHLNLIFGERRTA